MLGSKVPLANLSSGLGSAQKKGRHNRPVRACRQRRRRENCGGATLSTRPSRFNPSRRSADVRESINRHGQGVERSSVENHGLRPYIWRNDRTQDGKVASQARGTWV